MNQKGFTLLEVMVSFALIVMVAFATVMAQSGSLSASSRNKNVIIATNLARNLINEKELIVEGKNFDNLPEKESQAFPDPNKDFKYTIEYSKVDFSALTDLIARQSQAEADKAGANANDTQQTGMLLKMFKEYLEKSVRRMKVTIEWPEGKGTSNQTFTQLLVNYDTDFNVSI